MSTFFERLLHHSTNRSEHAAVVTDNQIWTYGDLLSRVAASRDCLRMQGVGPGARIGVSIADEVEHLLATLSLMAAGAGHVVLATHETPTSRALLAERVHLTHVISTDVAYSLNGKEFLCWPCQALETPAKFDVQSSEFGPTIYLRTSGTTGDSNIIAFSDDQLAAQSKRHSDYSNERMLRLASIEYNNSKRHRLYCVWAGGTNVFRPRGALDIVDFTLRHGVTCLDISRIHASDLTAAKHSYKLKGVKLRGSGSAFPADLRQRIQSKVSQNFYLRYGATECGSIAMALPGEHDADETSGKLFDGIELQIVGPDDSILRVGQSGEIRLQAPGMATGYFNSPGESVKRFRNGWFYPGDIGCLRADGQLIVLGRKDDMIILNGVNICPAEIERVLESHPAVAAAAALPLPSGVHGQIPVAAVELHPGAVVTTAELQSFARQQLAIRAPRRILVMTRLPRNSEGKIQKRQISPVFGPTRGEACRSKTFVS